MVLTTRLISLRLASLVLALISVASSLHAENAQADALLQQGRVDEAGNLLHQALLAQPGDAGAHQLLCRVYYAQDMADSAVHECELATSNAPTESDHQVWLGRAYGLKASQANPLIAYGLAKKVRSSFERAVQLNPANVHAMSDLGQYYVAAPGFVGGGLDKAESLAQQMQPRFPAQAHRLLGFIANKRKDTVTAEAEFRAATAGKAPEAFIDLGQFYEEHGQPDKAVAALQAGIAADNVNDAALVDAASILTAAQRAPELAERLLRDYLASTAKSDSAPAFKVHVQLGDLLLHRGDSTGARREYTVALAMASTYAPARKAMQGL
jgi:tetratricopeptide (TPR) repeat protein